MHRVISPFRIFVKTLALITLSFSTCVIPDSLHLLLRITDRIFLKLIDELRTLDNIAGAVRGPIPSAGNIEKFEKFVKSLGFHFDFFVTETNQLAFTDLPGPQRLILLEQTKLADFIPDFLNVDDFQNLWEGFVNIYRLIQSAETSADAQAVGNRAKAWVTDFCTKVFLAKDCTPYMHILVHHIPEFVAKYGNITPFSQQKFEQLNHNLTQLYFRGSNHKAGSALTQILRRHNRFMHLELIPGVQRIKNKYQCSVCGSSEHRRPQCPKRQRLVLRAIDSHR